MHSTEALASFAARLDSKSLPAEVVHAARRAVLDCLGVTLAGAGEDASRLVVDQVLSQGGVPESTLLVHGGRTSAQNAALANGTASHVLDYDDTNRSMPGHPSVPILPAALALGERLGASGAEVLAAFVVGVEVECKLGKFTGREPYDKGWHVTSTLGVVGAAAAAGHLLRLDVPTMQHALGIAVSEAAGVRQNFGTMAKSLHVGRAAQGGVFAAEMAARGFTASRQAIEGPAGFWDVFEGPVTRDGASLAAALGQPFEVVSPGIDFKAYPCCASTHPSIDAALQAGGGQPEDRIDRVRVEVPYSAPLMLIHHRPTVPLAAKFSLEYCVAAALVDGRVGLTHFTQESVDRSDLQSLLRRVEYRVPEEWQKRTGHDPGPWARIEVRLRDGSVLRGETTVPRGNASNPLGDEELEAKFLECAGLGLGNDRALTALDLIRRFEQLGDVRELTEKLVAN